MLCLSRANAHSAVRQRLLLNFSDMWKLSVKDRRLERSFMLGGFSRVEHLFPVTVHIKFMRLDTKGIACFLLTLELSKGKAGGHAC